MSRVLAQRWQWYAASGQLKDMAARTLLLKLQERGDLVLPERRHAPVVRGSVFHPDLFDALAPEPIIADLSSLQRVCMRVAGGRNSKATADLAGQLPSDFLESGA